MVKSKSKINVLFISFGYLIVVVLATVVALFAVSAHANEEVSIQSQNTRKNIFILIAEDYGVPWYSMLSNAIYKTFKADSNTETELYTEYTGLSRISNKAYMIKLRDLYAQKYADMEMDLIIVIDNPATDFIIEYGNDLFPGTPIVCFSETEYMEKVNLSPNMTGIFGTMKMRNTLDIAIKLHPDTRYIAVITGTSVYDLYYEEEARTAFRDYEKHFKFIYLAGLRIEDLLVRVAQLPQHTIVFYAFLRQDGAGKDFIPKEILTPISHASNAPLYGLWDSFLGSGIVGGYLSSVEVAGAKIGKMGLRILHGEKPKDIPVSKGFFAYMFDWQQLQYWNIDEDQLPEETIIINKPPDILKEYKWHIIAVGVTIFFLLLFSSALTWVLRLRNIALQELAEERENLERKVYERTQQLNERNKEVTKKNEIITQDLIVAKSIQQRMFTEYSNPPYLKIVTKYIPHSHVSGDIYKVYPYENETYNLFLGDSTGHGVSAALSTVMANVILLEDKQTPLEQIMEHLNEVFEQNLPEEHFMTAILVNVNSQGELRIFNAGHPDLIVIPANGDEPVLLEEKSTILGIFPNNGFAVKETKYSLMPGDRGILYTDGIYERQNLKEEIFGVDNMCLFLKENRSNDLDSLLSQLLGQVNSYAQGTEVDDDITLVAFEYIQT